MKRMISTLPQTMAAERGTPVDGGKGLSSKDSQRDSAENGTPTGADDSRANEKRRESDGTGNDRGYVPPCNASDATTARGAVESSTGKVIGEDRGEFSQGSASTGAGGKAYSEGFRGIPTTARAVRGGVCNMSP